MTAVTAWRRERPSIRVESSAAKEAIGSVSITYSQAHVYPKSESEWNIILWEHQGALLFGHHHDGDEGESDLWRS
jgi:hypothetical protein